MRTNIQIPAIIAVIMLLIAVFLRLPYDYYVILRWVVCIIAIYIAYISYQMKRLEWICIMTVIALVFNPIFRTHLSRDTWVIIDLIAAGFFVAAAYFLKNNRG